MLGVRRVVMVIVLTHRVATATLRARHAETATHPAVHAILARVLEAQEAEVALAAASAAHAPAAVVLADLLAVPLAAGVLVVAVAASLISKYDSLLLDLDGVVYEGQAAIDGAVEAVHAAQAIPMRVGYVTNNSSRRPETICEQLAGFGINSLPSDVISSGQTGVEILATMVPPGANILVVGGEGLRKRVVDGGFRLVESSNDAPAAVIQGFAPDVAWRDLAEAAFSIQRGAKWVATNQDWTLPQERGLAPGNGTLVSAVHTAVGILPIVAGKPEPAIFKTAQDHFASKKPLFVGDRIDTDIVGANRASMDSALALTGVSTRKELLGIGPEGRPTYILGNLSELHLPYEAPKQTKRGYSCGGVTVELLAQKVRVIDGDPTSLPALKAACAVIWNSDTPIYGLDVEPALYA
jgi:HAD superfamily hydrolase (TIGR01450 family)